MRLWLIVLTLLLAAGCTLGTPVRPTNTPEPTTFGAQNAPTVAPTAIVQQPIVTPISGATALPAGTVLPVVTVTPSLQPFEVATLPPLNLPSGEEEDNSLAGGFIRGIILPIWNFILDLTVGTAIALWNQTGVQGGLTAQVICCVLPAVLLMAFVFSRVAQERDRRGRRG